jgi:hypothetical protein
MPSNAIVLKMEKSLFFINMESFKQRLFKHFGFNPANVDRHQKYVDEKVIQQYIENLDDDNDGVHSKKLVQYSNIILDFSAVNYIDTVSVISLQQVYKKFEI